jgi:hypothetical protein
MEKRIFKNSDLELSILGTGCWTFGGGEYWEDQNQNDVNEVVHASVDLGIRAWESITTRKAICWIIWRIKEIFDYKGGYVKIPEGPGLGLKINEDHVRKMAEKRTQLEEPSMEA